MAKPKPKAKAPKEVVAKPKIPETNLGEAEIRKKFGDGIIIPASEILEEKPEIISVCPSVDAALGGGIMTGTFVTLTGPAGCGKTTTALHIAKNWQKLGRKVYIFATEWRLNPRDLEAISELDPDLVGVIRSTDEHKMTAQDFLQAADIIMKNQKYAMIVFDSFSMIADEDELSNDDYKQSAPAVVNRMVSKFCRRMVPILPINKNVLIGVFHVYSNIGGKTARKSSVPTKVEFTRSTGLYCNWAEPWKDKPGEDGKQIGQVAHWTVERSMLPGGLTGSKADSMMRYGHGIDVNAELFVIGDRLGLITGTGWYTLSFLGADAPKLQGKEKVIAYLDSHSEASDALYESIKGLLAS